MYFNLYGPDFLRLQSDGISAAADPLDPSVLFSGGFEDARALYFSQAVSAPNMGTASYQIDFGQTFAAAPVVIGSLRLTQACVQDPSNINVNFPSGTILAPCNRQYYRFNVGTVVRYGFDYTAYENYLNLSIEGFVGVVSLLVLDVS